ncbi:MAG TPA: EthD family reductase [Pseudolabrys sp.]|nr:EthD family reductase [Pseudolabrys sp.]
MARLVVMYRDPKDAGVFDKYYFEKHVPLAKKIPGLRKYEVSQGPVLTPAGPSGIHLIATLHFDDMAAIQNAFASAEGQAAAADVPTFATGGVDMFLFDSREI